MSLGTNTSMATSLSGIRSQYLGSASGILLEVSSAYLFGCIMIMIWNFLNTFMLEVELVWKAPNTSAKFIYLWNRYFSLVIGLGGLAYWIALLGIDGPWSCQVISVTPLIFGVALLGAHSVLAVQVITLYQGVRIVAPIIWLLVLVTPTVEILCFLNIYTGYVLRSVTTGKLGQACFKESLNSPIIISGFLWPIVFHVILLVMTAVRARSHAKETNGLLSSSIDQPLLHHQFIFTVSSSIAYIFNSILFLQPIPFSYQIMIFIPALIFTQIFLDSMYLGIKKLNMRSKLFAALGDGLRPLELPAEDNWVELDKTLAHEVFPLATFDPIPMRHLGSGAQLRGYLQNYGFTSNISSMFVASNNHCESDSEAGHGTTDNHFNRGRTRGLNRVRRTSAASLTSLAAIANQYVEAERIDESVEDPMELLSPNRVFIIHRPSTIGVRGKFQPPPSSSPLRNFKKA